MVERQNPGRNSPDKPGPRESIHQPDQPTDALRISNTQRLSPPKQLKPAEAIFSRLFLFPNLFALRSSAYLNKLCFCELTKDTFAIYYPETILSAIAKIATPFRYYKVKSFSPLSLAGANQPGNKQSVDCLKRLLIFARKTCIFAHFW